jgi:UDP-glucose 4-epimerase
VNILVLGGTGFLGSQIVKKLSGDNSVCVFSPSASSYDFPNHIITVDGSIENTNSLKTQIAWANIIFHFVSTTNPKTSMAYHQYDLSSNLSPLVGVLELMKSYPDKKIIFCSSGGTVYGNKKVNSISETCEKKPSTSYGLVKSLMEEYIEYFHRIFGINYLILRPANVYGLNLRSLGNQGIISTLLYNTILKKPSTFWADLNNTRDYIHIDDFTEAVMGLLNYSAFGIYNIGSGSGTSLKQIIDAVQVTCETEVKFHMAEKLIKDESYNVLDIDKIKSLTGWRPVIGIEQGVNMVYNQMKLQLENCQISLDNG